MEAGLKELGEGMSKLAPEFWRASNSALGTTISSATPGVKAGQLLHCDVLYVIVPRLLRPLPVVPTLDLMHSPPLLPKAFREPSLLLPFWESRLYPWLPECPVTPLALGSPNLHVLQLTGNEPDCGGRVSHSTLAESVSGILPSLGAFSLWHPWTQPSSPWPTRVAAFTLLLGKRRACSPSSWLDHWASSCKSSWK